MRLFMHIPKSGGTSVASALKRAAAPGAVAPRTIDGTMFGPSFDFGLLPARKRSTIAVTDEEIAELGRYEFVCGHFSLDTLERIAPPSSIVTVLREPRARLLSLYAYWHGSQDSLGTDWGVASPQRHALRTLTAFLTEPGIASATDQCLTRYVLGRDPRLPSSSFVDAAQRAGLARDAIDRLERIGLVTIAEQGDLFADLSRALGVELDPTYENVTPDGSAAAPADAEPPGIEDPKVLELLDARTAVDAIVYEHFAAARVGDREQARKLGDAAFQRRLELARIASGGHGTPGGQLPQASGHGVDSFPDAATFERDTQIVLMQHQIGALTAWGLHLAGELAHREAEISRLRSSLMRLSARTPARADGGRSRVT